MHKETVGSKIVKWMLIGISVLFAFLMLVLPLITVITEALSSGWKMYIEAVTDKYTVKAIQLTLLATVCAVVFNTVFGLFAAWTLTKFRFRGKKLLTTLIDVPVTVSPIIAGLIFILTFGRQSPIYPLLESLNIKVVFAVPGIILATVFVTFPFISRELIPVLEAQGTDEEEAAALMGANGWTIKTEFPCELEVNEYKENHAFDLALKSISEYTAAVFTSANAVRIFFDRLKKLRIDIRKLAHMRFAAIGSGTADILSEYGIFADMIPEKYTSAQLGKLLAESCGSEDNILIPRAEQGSSELTDPLDASGIRYNEIRIYDVCVSEKVKPCRIENNFLVFGSSSGVRDFFDGGFEVSDSTEIICIGEITAAELEKRSGRKCGVSLSQDADGIAEHIRKSI